MYLFFDTETTGLPRDYNAPIEDVNNWPRLVQLAWALYNTDELLIEQRNYIIRPVGFVIPHEVIRIHGITNELALAKGFPLIDVLNEFIVAMDKASHLVAHNISYDLNILGAEGIRTQIKIPFDKMVHICTMRSSAEFCKIPGTYGYKWPNLNELYLTLFREPIQNGHNALVDVNACARSFFELKRRGAL